MCHDASPMGTKTENRIGGRAAAADRAALGALAARGGTSGRRARIVLSLESGVPPVRIRRELGVTYATIRAARARWREGGAAALAARKAAKPPKESVAADRALRLRPGIPDILREEAVARRRRGRVPAERLAVETWARDAVALGLVAPGRPFPPMRRVRDAFRVSLTIVRDAFASLARQGFAAGAARKGTVAADPAPFAGRYLFVERESRGNDRLGYRGASHAAAERLAAARGVRFDFTNGDDGVLERRTPGRASLLAEIRRQRWAGVFVREWNEHMELAGAVRIDDVPVCVPHLLGHRPRSLAGTHVAKPVTPSPASLMERLVADCAAAGRCRLAVVDQRYFPDDGFRRKQVAGLARRHGMELGPWHYQELSVTGETPGERGVVRAALAGMLAPGRDWTPDCIVLMDDHWLGPLEEVLDALGRGAGGSRRGPSADGSSGGIAPPLVVGCIGNKPALPETRIPVLFHGYDLEATLVSFLDWCDAIHSGRRGAPPPRMATF